MKKAFVLVILGCWLVSACGVGDITSPAPTPTPTRRFTRTPRPILTPTLTLPPTLTSTPQPPLTFHEWIPEQVLIYKNSGKWPARFGPLFPPDFILYADGGLFVIKYDQEKIRLLFRKLNQNEICQHLNTLDQIGYLDFQPSTYDSHVEGYTIMDGGAERINVNAWKLSQGVYYSLSTYLYDEASNNLHPSPFIAPALRDTYYFLSEYPVDKLQIYQPDRLGIWVSKYEEESTSKYPLKFGPWPFSDLSLNGLWAITGSLDSIEWERYVVLRGEQARRIYDFLGQSFYDAGVIVYEEGADGTKTQYLMFARPLLPYENHPGQQIPAPRSPNPNFKLNCYPSDGVLPIPPPPNYD